MKPSNRIILYCLYIVMIASAFSLTLNYAAPNPTGRWFSSAYVDTTQSGRVFGAQAELILARDLEMPQNDTPEGNRVCFCNRDAQAPPGRCNACEVNSGNISTWSMPDFVDNTLIIDSKAVNSFTITEQISNFILVAELSNRPLWIYVRRDTFYSGTTLQRIQATGGGIVKYYVVEGHEYLLVVEQSINNIIIIAIVFAAGIMIWQFIALRTNDAPHDDYRHDDMDAAEDSVEDTEEFMRRMERLSKRTIKKDDDDKKK